MGTRDTECPICGNLYEEPKILPCGHTFCRSPCLTGCVDAQRRVTCPICRTVNKDVEVDSLPTVYILQSMCQALREKTCAGCGEVLQSCERCTECKFELCPHCAKSFCVPRCRDTHTTLVKTALTKECDRVEKSWQELDTLCTAARKKVARMEEVSQELQSLHRTAGRCDSWADMGDALTQCKAALLAVEHLDTSIEYGALGGRSRGSALDYTSLRDSEVTMVSCTGGSSSFRHLSYDTFNDLILAANADKICLFTPEGEHTRHVTLEKPERGRKPELSTAVAVTKELMAASDSYNSQILLVNFEGEILQRVGKQGSAENGNFASPDGLAVSRDRLYVADWGNHCVQVLTFDGKQDYVIPIQRPYVPLGMAFNFKADILAVAQERRIELFSGSDGTPIRTIGDDDLMFCRAITFDPTETQIIATETIRMRAKGMQVYNLEGEQITSLLEGRGPLNGVTSLPRGSLAMSHGDSFGADEIYIL